MDSRPTFCISSRTHLVCLGEREDLLERVNGVVGSDRVFLHVPHVHVCRHQYAQCVLAPVVHCVARSGDPFWRENGKRGCSRKEIWTGFLLLSSEFRYSVTRSTRCWLTVYSRACSCRMGNEMRDGSYSAAFIVGIAPITLPTDRECGPIISTAAPACGRNELQ